MQSGWCLVQRAQIGAVEIVSKACCLATERGRGLLMSKPRRLTLLAPFLGDVPVGEEVATVRCFVKAHYKTFKREKKTTFFSKMI